MSLDGEDAREAAVDAAAQHQRDYRLTFGAPWGRAVLIDLMKFCKFRVPLGTENIQIEEGRRQVFLRIVERLALGPEQLLQLYGGHAAPTGESHE